MASYDEQDTDFAPLNLVVMWMEVESLGDYYDDDDHCLAGGLTLPCTTLL